MVCQAVSPAAAHFFVCAQVDCASAQVDVARRGGGGEEVARRGLNTHCKAPRYNF